MRPKGSGCRSDDDLGAIRAAAPDGLPGSGSVLSSFLAGLDEHWQLAQLAVEALSTVGVNATGSPWQGGFS